MQSGKTRWSHYQIAYHFVWIPKYRRRILTGDVQVAAKAAITRCCEQHGFQLLALETDEDHVHCFVSAPPKDSPAKIVGLLKGTAPGFCASSFRRWQRKLARHSSGPAPTTSAPRAP